MKPGRKSVTSKALALATGAGAAAFTGHSADAAIMIGNAPATNPVMTNSGTVSWDIDGAGGADFEFFASVGSSLIILDPLAGASLKATPSGSVFTFDALANLGDSYNLGAGMPTTDGNFADTSFLALSGGTIQSSVDQFATDVMGHIGFSFDIGGDTHFGYAEITISEGANTVTIGNVFYEDEPNTAIHVGTIPEPSSLTLLALGAAGLATWRRRRGRGI